MTQDNGEVKWSDATSYSRGQRGNIDPTAWEICLHGVRVWISSKHLYNPNNWSLTCSDVRLEAHTICSNDAHPDAAKDAALAVVAAKLREKSESFRLAADAMLAARKGEG
jgi:hypothetical protein